MSVSTGLNKHVYLADGETYDWPFTFPIAEASDVEAWEKVGAALSAKLTTGYTVNVNAGTVTYPNSGDPRPTGNKIILLRAVPATQDQALSTTGSSNPKNYETMFDRLTLMIADLREITSRCIKFPVDVSPADAETDGFLAQIQAVETDAESAKNGAQTAQSAAETAEAGAAAARTAAEAAQAAAEAAAAEAAASLAAMAQPQSGLYANKPASPVSRVEYYSTDRDCLEIWRPEANRWFLIG